MKSSRKSTPIRQSARDEDCTLRIPGVCNSNPETVVLCHAPYPGRSGTRTDDWWAAYGCSSCHSLVDSNIANLFDYWLPAIHETQKKLITKGLIIIGAEK